MRAVRTTKWKYIRNYSDDAVGLDQCAHMEWAHRLCELPNQGWIRPRVPEELYDLENDPNEQGNLVDDPAFKAELEMMRNRLDRHMRETGDPYMGREFEKNYSAKDFGIESGSTANRALQYSIHLRPRSLGGDCPRITESCSVGFVDSGLSHFNK